MKALELLVHMPHRNMSKKVMNAMALMVHVNFLVVFSRASGFLASLTAWPCFVCRLRLLVG